MTTQIIKTDTVKRLTFVDYIACFVLPVLSQYANWLQNTTGIDVSIAASIFIVLALVSAICRGRCTTRIPLGMLLAIAGVTIVCMSSLVNGSDIVNAVKPILLMTFVCVVGPLITPAGIRLFIGTVIGMSIIITVDAMLNIDKYASEGLSLYNIRQSTMVDKPVYTILYALSITLIITYFNKLRNNVERFLAVVLIAVEIYFGFSIIESKTFLFAVALSAVVLYFISARKGEANVLIPLTVLAIALLLLLFLYSHPEFIPDSVRSLLSNLLGIDITYSARYGGTYLGRSTIIAVALSEFAHHPITGIGFGNFIATYIWGGVEHTVTQTESSWLSFLAEGGIFYFLIQLILNLYLIVRLYRHAIKTRNRAATAMLLMLIAFNVLNVVNDFANNFYWCALAVAYSLTNENTEFVRGYLPHYAIPTRHVTARTGEYSGINQSFYYTTDQISHDKKTAKNPGTKSYSSF